MPIADRLEVTPSLNTIVDMGRHPKEAMLAEARKRGQALAKPTAGSVAARAQGFKLQVRVRGGVGRQLFRCPARVSGILLVVSVHECGRDGALRIRLYDPLAAAERELWLAANWRAAVLGVSSDNWRAWRDALLRRLSLQRRLAPGVLADPGGDGGHKGLGDAMPNSGPPKSAAQRAATPVSVLDAGGVSFDPVFHRTARRLPPPPDERKVKKGLSGMFGGGGGGAAAGSGGEARKEMRVALLAAQADLKQNIATHAYTAAAASQAKVDELRAALMRAASAGSSGSSSGAAAGSGSGSSRASRDAKGNADAGRLMWVSLSLLGDGERMLVRCVDSETSDTWNVELSPQDLSKVPRYPRGLSRLSLFVRCARTTATRLRQWCRVVVSSRRRVVVSAHRPRQTARLPHCQTARLPLHGEPLGCSK